MHSKKMWIMWITWCITAFPWKIEGKAGGQLSTISLWIVVDNVDKSGIECMVCAICMIYHKVSRYVTEFENSTGTAPGTPYFSGTKKGSRREERKGRE